MPKVALGTTVQVIAHGSFTSGRGRVGQLGLTVRNGDFAIASSREGESDWSWVEFSNGDVKDIYNDELEIIDNLDEAVEAAVRSILGEGG